MKLPVLFVIGSVAFAAVSGTVQNLTSGKGQANAVITLVELGAGMNNLGSVRTDANGRFTFDATLKSDIPYLLQALHQGVTYNQMLQPGQARDGMSVSVYDAATKAPEAKVSQHMILLEPTGSELVVNESVIFNNTGKLTYFDPAGTLKVFIPGEVKSPVRMRITAPQGMPISREAEKGSERNVYVARYPIKPGETRIDLQYTLPPTAKYASRILHTGGPVRIVAPQGVTFVSDALTNVGPEPRTQATIYEVKGTEFAIDIQGTGALRESTTASAGGETKSAAEEDTSPSIEMVKPRLYQRVGWVVGLALTMLAVGFVALYRGA